MEGWCPGTPHYSRVNCIDRVKATRWEKIHHANNNQKKARMPVLLSDKVDFRIGQISGEKERFYIMIKE